MMWSKFQLLLISFVFFLLPSLFIYGDQLPARIQSRYGVLMNAESGCTLYEKRANEQIHPSSTMKIATALYVMHRLGEAGVDELVTAPGYCLKKLSREEKDATLASCPPYILQTDGTTYHILEGEVLSVRSLLYGLLLSSGNDAANVLADYVGGEGMIEAFMAGLNEYVRALGCHHTHFVNPHGLNYPGQYSTPYDMALIAKEALKYPLIKEIVSSTEYVREKTNKQPPKRVYQMNKLVIEGALKFDEAHGMKTGYTSDGGYCLLACAQHGDRQLVAALFNSRKQNFRYHDAIEMFSRAFEEAPIEHKLFNRQSHPFFHAVDGGKRVLKVVPHEDVVIEYYPSESPPIESKLLISNDVHLPVYEGDCVGELAIYLAGIPAHSVPVYAASDLSLPWYRKKGVWLLGTSLLILFAYAKRYLAKREKRVAS